MQGIGTDAFQTRISDLRQPPGPRGLRGSLLATYRLNRGFLPFLCDLEAEYSGAEMAPVGFRIMGQKMYLVVHPAHIKRLLLDGDNFTRTTKYMNAFKMVLGYNIISADMDEWRPLRKRTARFFGKPQLEQYGRVITDVLLDHSVPALAERARRGEAIDVFSEMLDVASIAIFKSFLGPEDGAVPRPVYRALNEIFCYIRRNMFSIVLPPLWVPTAENRELREHLDCIHGYLRSHLTRQRAQQTVMGEVARAHLDEHGRIDVHKVVEEMTSLLVGGSETTIILMAWALYFLVQHPGVEERLLEEIRSVVGDDQPTVAHLKRMPYLESVVSETLRLRSPAYVLSRMSLVNTQLGGYAIERGAMIFASQHITHQHPRVWRNPERFDPGRFDASSPEAPTNRREETPFFPFGGGSFNCIGMNFAFYEASLMLIILLQRFRFAIAEPRRFAEVGLDARLTLRPDRPIRLMVQERTATTVSNQGVSAT
jgi:cytochrome P450